MYKNILVPIAFGHESDMDAPLQLAQRLRASDGKIVLLNVLEPISSYVAAYLPEDAQEKQHAEAVKMLGDAAQKVDGSVEKHVMTGNAGARILEFAEENGCDCIVVLSHKPGLEDYFLGSTAARVVRHAQCSVHVVR